MDTTEHLDLQATTMAGDIRDMLLTHIRSMETPWSKLSEDQQRDRIDAAASAGRDLVRRSVQLVAHRGFAHMPITLKDWTVKDGIQLKVTALDTVEEITKLAEHRSGSAIIVFASTSAFLGARADVEPDPDQPALDVDQEQPPVEPPSIEESEAQVGLAKTLQGMTVRLDHFEPSERRDALQALALSKGASA